MIERTVDAHGCVLLSNGCYGWVGNGSMFGVELLPEKRAVTVYAFHTADSCGGFFWAESSNDSDVSALVAEFEADAAARNYETGVLCELRVIESLAGEELTRYLEGEIQDAIEVGSIGRVLRRYRPTLGQVEPPIGSIITTPFDDLEGDVAERMSDGYWLVVGEEALWTWADLVGFTDAPITILRHGYGDES
jgi:hypothetical protein